MSLCATRKEFEENKTCVSIKDENKQNPMKAAIEFHLR